MTDPDTRRRDTFARLLGDLHRALQLDFSFRLWDGTTIPADADPSALRIAFNTQAAVAALVRSPRIDTLIEAYASGAIDLENGSLFDFAERRPKAKVGRIIRQVSVVGALSMVRQFWGAPRSVGRPDLAGIDVSEGTAAGNKRNIAHHYDVGNAFYRLFLDAAMVYSCAYFTSWHDDIDKAQFDKLEMICRKLRLKPGERLLDIGCGWGALVLHAVRHHGVTAVGVTLSEEQAALARQRIADAGLAGSITIELRDFASLEGQFDKISSIGMFEHVGLKHHERYFRTVHRLLKPGGLYLHHAITRRAKKSDKAFARGTREYRALTRYIFPGGELDHIGLSSTNLERYGFEVRDVENWREHYARTCRLWWERLSANQDQAQREAGLERTRLWLIYLAGCSLAFERGGAQIFQTVAVRRSRGPTSLPPTREDLYRSP